MHIYTEFKRSVHNIYPFARTKEITTYYNVLTQNNINAYKTIENWTFALNTCRYPKYMQGALNTCREL